MKKQKGLTPENIRQRWNSLKAGDVIAEIKTFENLKIPGLFYTVLKKNEDGSLEISICSNAPLITLEPAGPFKWDEKKKAIVGKNGHYPIFGAPFKIKRGAGKETAELYKKCHEKVVALSNNELRESIEKNYIAMSKIKEILASKPTRRTVQEKCRDASMTLNLLMGPGNYDNSHIALMISAINQIDKEAEIFKEILEKFRRALQDERIVSDISLPFFLSAAEPFGYS